MNSVKKAAALLSAFGLAAGMVALAPVASADNYAPTLPSNVSKPGARLTLTIDGAQPGCRVTYTFQRFNRQTNEWELFNRTRTGVQSNGTATSSLKAPSEAGLYRLVTRVDNFPGSTGCTSTKTVQRVVVR